MGHIPRENRLNWPGTSYPPIFDPRFGVKSKLTFHGFSLPDTTPRCGGV